jgi:aldose 1-epimerase
MADVVLGHDSLEEYIGGSNYFGAIIGRFANRIANARFTVDGKTYRLAANNGPNHLHGGRTGFDRVVWRAAPFCTDRAAGVALSYTSPDGEEGYPGNLDVGVTYTLTDRNELVVDFLATTDRATPVNLTQHTCFNLTGDGVGDILRHLLRINADRRVASRRLPADPSTFARSPPSAPGSRPTTSSSTGAEATITTSCSGAKRESAWSTRRR